MTPSDISGGLGSPTKAGPESRWGLSSEFLRRDGPLATKAFDFGSGRKSSDHVNSGGENDGSEEVGEQCVAEGCGPEFMGFEVGVGDLECHADGEREVGEFEVGGFIFLVEVDPSVGGAVVEPGVAKGEQGVDQKPGQHHTGYGERCQ